MREILFRGRRVYNGEWIEGNLLVYPLGKAVICGADQRNRKIVSCRVDPATVGQYTGLLDKNGKRIFEGDIIEFEWNGRVIRDVVVFKSPMFSPSNYVRWSMDKDRVIGNIHDNPELLGVTEC